MCSLLPMFSSFSNIFYVRFVWSIAAVGWSLLSIFSYYPYLSFQSFFYYLHGVSALVTLSNKNKFLSIKKKLKHNMITHLLSSMFPAIVVYSLTSINQIQGKKALSTYIVEGN